MNIIHTFYWWVLLLWILYSSLFPSVIRMYRNKLNILRCNRGHLSWAFEETLALSSTFNRDMTWGSSTEWIWVKIIFELCLDSSGYKIWRSCSRGCNQLASVLLVLKLSWVNNFLRVVLERVLLLVKELGSYLVSFFLSLLKKNIDYQRPSFGYFQNTFKW